MKKLTDEVRRLRPDIDDPEAAIRAGRVRVAGAVIMNPASRVKAGASIVVVDPMALRGSVKLSAALDIAGLDPSGLTCLDVGAATGGFTAELLDRGAARVYAVDVGTGQLLGSLRQDDKVVNLEATNVADLNAKIIDSDIDLVVVDVSYLSLASAVSQLTDIEFAPGALLLGLVKPMFELRLGSAPTDPVSVESAMLSASGAIGSGNWTVQRSFASPVTGAGGAREGWVLASRATAG